MSQSRTLARHSGGGARCPCAPGVAHDLHHQVGGPLQLDEAIATRQPDGPAGPVRRRRCVGRRRGRSTHRSASRAGIWVRASLTKTWPRRDRRHSAEQRGGQSGPERAVGVQVFRGSRPPRRRRPGSRSGRIPGTAPSRPQVAMRSAAALRDADDVPGGDRRRAEQPLELADDGGLIIRGQPLEACRCVVPLRKPRTTPACTAPPVKRSGGARRAPSTRKAPPGPGGGQPCRRRAEDQQ